MRCVTAFAAWGALCFGLAAPAFAEGDSAQLLLQGRIPEKCAFTTVPPAAQLGDLRTGDVTDIGEFKFTCNLAASGSVSLSIQSQNGGLKREGGSETVGYAASWDVQGNGGIFYDVAAYTSATGFTLQSGQAGMPQGGSYKIKITGATESLVAGAYQDRITYTIAP